MEYTPLYRKYRPQTLEEIVGQEHIKKALTNAIAMDKISHAYLFTGPRGTGKTSAARILAKSLNCKNGPTATPCGTCENCVDITNSTPMDVIEIDAASNRKVEDAQNILEKVMYAPLNSRYKIYIIDEVHMLSTTAFNALLKTLEEPPKNVIFILATTEVHKVLDTIKSRCQRFDFKRITTDDITAHLKTIAGQEQINITDDALTTIAKNAAGAMRDSIALLDQLAVLGGSQAVTTDDINNLLGRLSFGVLSALAGKILASNPQNAVEDLENIYNSGNEPVQILSGLMDYFKNLLIAKNCRDEIVSELTQAGAEQIKVLKEQSANVETHQLVFLVDKSAQYIKEIKSASNPRLWLEVAIIDLANLATNTSLVELQNRIAALEGVNGGNVQPVQQIAKPVYKAGVNALGSTQVIAKQEPEPEPPRHCEEGDKPDVAIRNNIETKEVAPSAPSGNQNDLWVKLLDNIQSPPTRALLKQWAKPAAISQEGVVIAIKEIYLNQFVEGMKKQLLEDAVTALFGQPVKVTVQEPGANDVPQTAPEPEAVSAPPPAPVEEITPEEVAEAQEEIETIEANEKPPVVIPSDQVNMVLDLFDGKVII
jgi:DNA polymerase-3 subunit gamma/tau